MNVEDLMDYRFARHVKRGSLYVMNHDYMFVSGTQLDESFDGKRVVGAFFGKEVVIYREPIKGYEKQKYYKLQTAKPITNTERMYQYTSAIDYTEKWVRPVDEFLDGRFEFLNRKDLTELEKKRVTHEFILY